MTACPHGGLSMPLAVRIAVLVLVVSGVLLALALLVGSALPARHVLAYYSLLAEGGAIHLLDADRSLSVPSYRTSAYIQAMAWSPDAEHIAFITYEDNSYFLNTVAADGRNAHRLTDQTASTRRPVWSPDSQWIAFDSQMVTGTMLFLVGANGTNLRDMMGSGNGASGDLVWSPDGRQVALASWSTGNATFEIFMMDAAPCISGDSICRPKPMIVCPHGRRMVSKSRFCPTAAVNGKFILKMLIAIPVVVMHDS
jgi:hypothetical protein